MQNKNEKKKPEEERAGGGMTAKEKHKSKLFKSHPIKKIN